MSKQRTKSFMERVEAGSYYTDGAQLWRVVHLYATGGVDLQNESTGQSRFMGIDAFRREMWRVR